MRVLDFTSLFPESGTLPTREFLESLPLAAYGCNLEGRIVFFNQRAVDIWGREPSDSDRYCGSEKRFLLDGTEVPLTSTPVAEVLRTGRPLLGHEGICERPDGQRVVCQVNVTPVRDGQGALTGVINLFQDVTEKARVREDEAKQRELAVAADRAKNLFLMNMSHEMKTPLAAIIGFADILRDETVALADKGEILERISRNGENLLEIIDNVLDLSRLEANTVTLSPRAVAPWDVVSEALSLLHPDPSKTEVAFDVQLASDDIADLYTDPMRLRQILCHLLSNALKYTQRGEIAIKISNGLVNEAWATVFEISDTGLGIDPEIREALFDPLGAGDMSSAKRFGGAGLGLLLSRRLAECLGGQLILISSEREQGTRFQLVVPQLPGAEAVTKPNPPRPFGLKDRHEPIDRSGVLIAAKPLAGHHILVVDDNPDNRFVISSFLRLAGATWDFAENGVEAVERAMTRRHDLVLMDLQMPVMDGLLATAQLRAQGYGKPIIALSAYAAGPELIDARRAGCDDHLSKPTTIEALVRKVLDHLVK